MGSRDWATFAEYVSARTTALCRAALVKTYILANAAMAFPVVWLDDTTLQVFVFAPPQRANMYTCTVPDGTCEVAADLPADQIDGNNLVLPDGNWTAP